MKGGALGVLPEVKPGAGEQITIVTRYKSETREQESHIPSNFEYKVDITAATPGC